MRKIKLTKMIFDYWKYHMCCPVESIEWGQQAEGEWSHPCYIREAEGLHYYDGYNATFWYILNLSWYKMNDRLYANTFNTQPFDPYLRDFDQDHLEENGYVREVLAMRCLIGFWIYAKTTTSLHWPKIVYLSSYTRSITSDTTTVTHVGYNKTI
jgi:uncharacterized membrane protein YbaN (DUF454 family)